MRPAELILDLNGCKNEDGLLDYLWDAFRFPPLYGRGWFGLAENMFYDPEGRMPEILKIRGLKFLSQVDPISAGKLGAVFADYLLDQDSIRRVLYEKGA